MWPPAILVAKGSRMIGASCRPRSAMVRLMLALVIGLAAEPAMAKTFRLSITGKQGARYAGQCTVLKDAKEEIIDLRGEMPLERTFVADGVDCRIEAKGRVVVEITHDGSWSRAATDGGFVNVQAR